MFCFYYTMEWPGYNTRFENKFTCFSYSASCFLKKQVPFFTYRMYQPQRLKSSLILFMAFNSLWVKTKGPTRIKLPSTPQSQKVSGPKL